MCYYLGFGDGGSLIAASWCRAVCIDIDPKRVAERTEREENASAIA